VRAFLTVILGAMLLGGCAAKPTARSAQAVSAQQDKDSAACLEQSLKKESYEEHQKSFASCMRARGYFPSETTTNAKSPLISDGLKNIARESSSELAASENYERAVADYNNCVLVHTSNLNACEKQQAIMNRLGKVSSRLSLSQSYQTTPAKNAGITQGANTANTTQATLSQVPARIPPQATPSQTPARMAPPTTSSMPAQISPPVRETVVDRREPVDAPPLPTPMPY
jgi:hypothetical protein